MGSRPKIATTNQPAMVVGLDGPRQAWGHPRPRGSAFGVLPGAVLAKREGAKDHLRRTPVPYPRMETGSRVPDARLIASKFFRCRHDQPSATAAKSSS